MASAWDWMWQSLAAARAAGDTSRLQMNNLRLRADKTPLDESEVRLDFYTQGRDLARHLGDDYWEMFFESQRIETLLHRLSRPEEALDVAVRAVLETRKPCYDGFPVRAGLRIKLVACYSYLDAVYYEARIREVFETLQGETESWHEWDLYRAQQWGIFLDNLEDAAALDAAWEYLSLSQTKNDDWHCRCALALLCETLWLFDRPTAERILGETAAEYERLSRPLKQMGSRARSQMFRALAARCAGDETDAQRLYQRAWNAQRNAPVPHLSIQFPAIAFHEWADEWALALRVCSSKILIARAHNLPFKEVHARLKRVELLKQAGRDAAPAAARLRAMLGRVKSRAHWEAKLRALGL